MITRSSILRYPSPRHVPPSISQVWLFGLGLDDLKNVMNLAGDEVMDASIPLMFHEKRRIVVRGGTGLVELSALLWSSVWSRDDSANFLRFRGGGLISSSSWPIFVLKCIMFAGVSNCFGWERLAAETILKF